VNRYKLFSSNGLRWILFALMISVILIYNYGLSLLVILVPLNLFLAIFFFDPDRELPSHPLGVMSPVDGYVQSIDLFHDPFLDRTCIRIRIHANLLRVYLARSPSEGKLMEYWPVVSEAKAGYNKSHIKGAWWIRTDEGDDIVMVVQSRSPLGRTYCHIQAGERIGQARRCGRFPVLSVIDLLVEEHSFIEVKEGQKVQSGVHTIATFTHDLAKASSSNAAISYD